jgi:hypothetical protein
MNFLRFQIISTQNWLFILLMPLEHPINLLDLRFTLQLLNRRGVRV